MFYIESNCPLQLLCHDLFPFPYLQVIAQMGEGGHAEPGQPVVAEVDQP